MTKIFFYLVWIRYKYYIYHIIIKYRPGNDLYNRKSFGEWYFFTNQKAGVGQNNIYRPITIPQRCFEHNWVSSYILCTFPWLECYMNLWRLFCRSMASTESPLESLLLTLLNSSTPVQDRTQADLQQFINRYSLLQRVPNPGPYLTLEGKKLKNICSCMLILIFFPVSITWIGDCKVKWHVLIA